MENVSKDLARHAFAARFRQALDELGVSPREQTRLQRIFGVSGQAVRKWLEGTAMPTSARIPRVAEILGVSSTWLQYGDGPMRPRQVSDDPGRWQSRPDLRPEEARLLARYRALSAEQRGAIDLLLRCMVGTPRLDSE